MIKAVIVKMTQCTQVCCHIFKGSGERVYHAWFSELFGSRSLLLIKEITTVFVRQSMRVKCFPFLLISQGIVAKRVWKGRHTRTHAHS